MRLATLGGLLTLATLAPPHVAPALAGDILNVPADYPTIQEALDAAVDGDAIVLATGFYELTETLAFPAVAVTLRSATLSPLDAVIDGSALKETAAMLRFEGQHAGTRAIRGLTFRNASLGVIMEVGADQMGLFRLEQNRFESIGGLRTVDLGDATSEVVDNAFIGNEGAIWGGALRVRGNTTITGNQFIDNHAIPFGVAELTQGGAIYLGGSATPGLTAEIRGNRFEGNTCTDYGGAIHVGSYHGVVTIAENDFVENEAGVCAGAIYQFEASSEITIEDNLFLRSSSPEGAAIALERIQLGAVRGNTIAGSTGGFAVKVTLSGNVTVERNVIASNPDGGLMEAGNTGFVSSCNVLFDNVPTPGRPAGGSGPGDLLVDPEFCDPIADDYSVAASSPCLPDNNECGQLIGARGKGCEAVAVEITSWGVVKDRFLR